MQSKKRTELWVGLFLLLGLLLLTVVAIRLGKFTSRMQESYTINVVFRNAAGIIKGSEVRLGGAKIGKVASTPVLTPGGDAVELKLELEKGINLQQGSVIQAATLNLLGDKYIEITPPTVSTNNFIAPGKTVYGDSGDDLETIKANVATISQQTIVLLRRVELAMGDMQAAAKGFADMSHKINEGVLSAENLKNMSAALDNIAKTSANLEMASRGVPATLDNIRETSLNIKTTSTDIHNLVVKVDKKVDELEPAFKAINPTLASLKNTSEKLDRTVSDIRKGEGIFGAMIYDKKLKLDIRDFVSHLRAQGLLRYKNPEAEKEILDLRDRAKMEGPRQ